MKFLDENISKITENISIDRLSSYKYDSNDGIDLVLRRYIYNIQISESFYPLLAALEISLRNRLYNAAASLKGKNWLLDEIENKNILNCNEHNILLEAYKKVKNAKDTVSTGAIIAELTFGFWVNLCKNLIKTVYGINRAFLIMFFPILIIILPVQHGIKQK